MTRKQGYLAILTILAATAAAPAQQAHTEVRDFVIQVGNKTAGSYKLTITRQADGTETAQASAAVEVKSLIGKYTYSIQATEVWKDYRLQQLVARGSDNGKNFEVTATAEPKGLHVRVNGRDQVTRADAWTTSYWKLAEARFHNKNVPLLDVDTGKEINGTLEYKGKEQMNVGGQVKECFHFKVHGPASPVDVWYDAYHRLVRQEFTESGQHTTFHLASVSAKK